jgi:hypothetical protein
MTDRIDVPAALKQPNSLKLSGRSIQYSEVGLKLLVRSAFSRVLHRAQGLAKTRNFIRRATPAQSPHLCRVAHLLMNLPDGAYAAFTYVTAVSLRTDGEHSFSLKSFVLRE